MNKIDKDHLFELLDLRQKLQEKFNLKLERDYKLRFQKERLEKILSDLQSKA